MIDFTNCEEFLNEYKGSEKKKTLIYNNKKYLVKFPDPIRQKNKNISYINNAYSEYIGSNIFKLTGFNTQNTILGKYTYNGKEKIVCACEDFTNNDNLLYEFETITLSINTDKKIGTELSDIMETIKEIKLINSDDILENFWNMFIIDALIGNTDRHNGNWGFLVNKNKISISPIYDCGSCLNPLMEDEEIEALKESDIKNLAINAYSCFKENGKKVNYMTYIKNKSNKYCNEALLRIFKNIDIEKIKDFINSTKTIKEVRKDFYIKIISIRYEILKETYDDLKATN